jgi:prepilin-type N-terminal cleavage/methylation domain-containing protein
MLNNNNYKGFTLAEILISLLVIGVIAGIVIPPIINDTQKAETALIVKKYQSTISNVALSIAMEYGGNIMKSPLYSNSDYANGWNAFKKYLVLIKDCNTTGQDCLANGYYKYLNGTNFQIKNSLLYGKGVLNDGCAIEFQAKVYCAMNRSTTNSGPLYNSNCSMVTIDVNGQKPPNQMGRDSFAWYILKDGTVYPIGSLDDVYLGCDKTSTDVTADSDGAPGAGVGCTAKVLQEGKIDY